MVAPVTSTDKVLETLMLLNSTDTQTTSVNGIDQPAEAVPTMLWLRHDTTFTALITHNSVPVGAAEAMFFARTGQSFIKSPTVHREQVHLVC